MPSAPGVGFAIQRGTVLDVKVLLQCFVGVNGPIRVGLLCGQHGCLGRGGIEGTFTKVHDRDSPKQPDTTNQHGSSCGVPCHVFSPSTTRARTNCRPAARGFSRFRRSSYATEPLYQLRKL